MAQDSPFTGLRAQSVLCGCTPGRGHLSTLLLLLLGRAGNVAEQKKRRKRRAKNFGVTHHSSCCAQQGTSHKAKSPLCLQRPPSQLCSAIRYLIMQQDTIAQFLQVWGPALWPAGTESCSAAPAASVLSSIPDRNVFCTCNCLSQQGTAHTIRMPVSGGPHVAPVAAWQGWSPKHPSLIEGDCPAPSHPRHAGKGGQEKQH